MLITKSSPEKVSNCMKGSLSLADHYDRSLQNIHRLNQGLCVHCPSTRDQWHELSTEQFEELESLILKDRELKSRLVFLPSIDMYMNHDNFICSVLAGIDQALNELRLSKDVMLELRRIMVDASIAGFGSFNQLRARACAMDSDAYATEVIRKSQCGIKFRERLAMLLADISRSTIMGLDLIGEHRDVRNPIFVVVYANAEISSSIEQFQLLFKQMNTLNVPHLFHININNIDEEDFYERFINLRRKKTAP